MLYNSHVGLMSHYCVHLSAKVQHKLCSSFVWSVLHELFN